MCCYLVRFKSSYIICNFSVADAILVLLMQLRYALNDVKRRKKGKEQESQKGRIMKKNVQHML
jgi:hypothetical protein